MQGTFKKPYSDRNTDLAQAAVRLGGILLTAVSQHCQEPAIKCINGMLEMMSDAPTNAGGHVMSNIASAHNQRYTKDSVF